MKEYHKCSTSWDYTRTVYPMSPRALNQPSSGRRWIRIPIPAAQRRAYGGETPNQYRLQNNGNPTWKEKERERLSQEKRTIGMMKKVHPSPPCIVQGEVKPSSPSHVGLNPTWGERAPVIGGEEPLPWRMAQGGKLSLPLMGHIRPICHFSFYLII